MSTILPHVNVILAGRTFTVVPLPIRQAAAWRKQLEGPFADVIAALSGTAKIELNDAANLSQLLERLRIMLFGSMDLVRELLYAYSPPIAQHADVIETEGYDLEIIDAFIEILKLAYPLARLRTLFSGLSGSTISENLPSVNGTTTLTPIGTLSIQRPMD